MAKGVDKYESIEKVTFKNKEESPPLTWGCSLNLISISTLTFCFDNSLLPCFLHLSPWIFLLKM